MHISFPNSFAKRRFTGRRRDEPASSSHRGFRRRRSGALACPAGPACGFPSAGPGGRSHSAAQGQCPCRSLRAQMPPQGQGSRGQGAACARHDLFRPAETLALSSDEAVNHSRPAIDVLFETAADAFGSALAAVVLTGANQNGAQGLKAVCETGGRGFVQDPVTAEVATMPEAALAASPAALMIRLDDIPNALQAMLEE